MGDGSPLGANRGWFGTDARVTAIALSPKVEAEAADPAPGVAGAASAETTDCALREGSRPRGVMKK
jgi:hypothetical protein